MARWDCFRNVILKNTQENFLATVLRPSKRYSETKAEIETYSAIYTDLALWFFPEEALSDEYQGRIYNVEAVFMMLPEAPVKRGDLIVRTGRPNNIYRVIGIADLLSHLEVRCYSPDMDSDDMDTTRTVETNAVLV